MNIFGYYNYRTYLKDYYESKKSADRTFSYRVFSQKAELKSPAVYLDLVKGRRNLTLSLIHSFAKALELNEPETKYLIHMMHFTHAKTAESKQDTFDVMSKMLPRTTRKLTRDQRKYFEQWYHIAVREALAVLDIDTDFEEISWFLCPKVPLPKIKQTMQLLIDLDLIEKTDGYWRSKNASIQGDHIDSLSLREVQKQLIDLGKESLDHFTKEKRNISNATVSVSSTGVERISRKIDIFRKEIVDIVQSDSDENQVYQFNVQFFPLSKERERE